MPFSTYKIVTVLGLAALSAGISFIGCSSDDTSTPTPTPDAGKDTGGQTGPVQKGQIVDLIRLGEGVPGVIVDIAGKTATTDNKGNYAVPITPNTPFFMKVSGGDRATLIEQEWSVTGEVDHGKTPVPSAGLAGLLTDSLSTNFGAIDKSKGVVAVSVVVSKQGTCDSEAGAKVSIEGATDADAGSDAGTDAGSGPRANRVVYFDGTQPRDLKGQDEGVKAGQILPSAIIYNVTPSQDVKITVTRTGCTQVKDFPIPDPTFQGAVKYTGRVQVQQFGNAPGALSFARIFLK